MNSATFSTTQLLVGLVAIAALAVVGGQARFVRMRRALGLEQLLASGFLFLPLGMLLSPAGLNVVTVDMVRELDALVTLGLGILGFLLGLRQDVRLGSPARNAVARGALVETGFTLVLVALPLYSLLEVAEGTPGQRAAAAALLGCAAALSAPLSQQAAARGRDSNGSRLVTEVADWGSVAAVFFAGVLLALLGPDVGMRGLERLLALAAIGVVGGIGTWLLAGETKEPALRTALLVGMLLVTAGTAAHLSLPPVAATLLAGIVIAELSPELARELRKNLDFLEPPLTVLLLVTAGAAMRVPDLATLAATAVFVVLRTAGKILGGRLGSRVSHGALPPAVGLGLLPFGALALGLALDFRLAARGELANVVVTTTLLGAMLSEVAGVWTTRILVRTTADGAVLDVPGTTPPPGVSPLEPTPAPDEPPANVIRLRETGPEDGR